MEFNRLEKNRSRGYKVRSMIAALGIFGAASLTLLGGAKSAEYIKTHDLPLRAADVLLIGIFGSLIGLNFRLKAHEVPDLNLPYKDSQSGEVLPPPAQTALPNYSQDMSFQYAKWPAIPLKDRLN